MVNKTGNFLVICNFREQKMIYVVCPKLRHIVHLMFYVLSDPWLNVCYLWDKLCKKQLLCNKKVSGYKEDGSSVHICILMFKLGQARIVKKLSNIRSIYLTNWHEKLLNYNIKDMRLIQTNNKPKTTNLCMKIMNIILEQFTKKCTDSNYQLISIAYLLCKGWTIKKFQDHANDFSYIASVVQLPYFYWKKINFRKLLSLLLVCFFTGSVYYMSMKWDEYESWIQLLYQNIELTFVHDKW